MSFDYSYQDGIEEGAWAVKKGIINAPTSSGKGYIAKRMVKTGISSLGWRSSAFFSHRLILNKQWFGKLFDYLKDLNCPINYIFVGSDSIDYKIIKKIKVDLYKKVGPGYLSPFATTDFNELREGFEAFKRKGYVVIVISTYQSNWVIMNAGLHFDCTFYDEAHTMVSFSKEVKNDYSEAADINSDRKYFFTATPRETISDDGRGMNNENKFGDYICKIKPNELIEGGYILKPILCIVSVDSKVKSMDVSKSAFNILEGDVDNKDFDSKSKSISGAMDYSRGWLRSKSAEPDKIKSKILYVCNGYGDMNGILKSKKFKQFRRKNKGIKVYTISSAGGIDCNGVIYKKIRSRGKEHLLSDLRNLRPDEEAIILHIDTIGEGLDVPGITGVFFFRDSNLEKWLQNIGRPGRLHPEDRRRLESGDLLPNDYKNYIKPGYLVFLPYMYDNKNDFFEQKRIWLLDFRDNYGFDTSQIINIDTLQPENKREGIDNETSRGQRASFLKKDWEMFYKMEDLRQEEINKRIESLKFSERCQEAIEKGNLEEFSSFLKKEGFYK